jgi:hypothetical protein
VLAPSAQDSAIGRSARQRPQPGGEGAQDRRLLDDLEPLDALAVAHQFAERFDHPVDVALRVDAARQAHPHEVVVGHDRLAGGAIGVAEHQRADLDRTHAALQIERASERLARQLLRRQVRQHRARVDVDRVQAGRSHDRHTERVEMLRQVRRTRLVVVQVVGIEHFAQALRQRREVAPGEATVGREALGQDQQVAHLRRQRVVVDAQETADVDEAVLLRRDHAAVGELEHRARHLRQRHLLPLRIEAVDPPGVLGEARGVEENGMPWRW